MKNLLILSLVLFTFGCQSSQDDQYAQEIEALQMQLDSLRTLGQKSSPETKGQIATFLTFQENNAEEAMSFYVSLFDNSKVTSIQRYGTDGPAKAGTIMFATFELNGSQYACSDSYIKHAWTFTPGVSNFVNCKSIEELENLFTQLSAGGQIMMPLDNYGFSQRFGFVEDRFGVSWQLNLD